jgi:hypothetical protein
MAASCLTAASGEGDCLSWEPSELTLVVPEHRIRHLGVTIGTPRIVSMSH